MKTQELLELLETQKNKSLLFEYSPGKIVGANFHITEVKNTTINSVDCEVDQMIGKRLLFNYGRVR